MLAVLFAAINFAAGGSAENRVGVSPIFDAERAEFMLQPIREPASDPLPIASAVGAAVNLSAGMRQRAGLTPGGRIVLRSGDKHEVGIARMPNEPIGINVRGPIGAGPAFPTRSASEGDIESGAAGNENLLRVARVDERAMNIIKMLDGPILGLPSMPYATSQSRTALARLSETSWSLSGFLLGWTCTVTRRRRISACARSVAPIWPSAFADFFETLLSLSNLIVSSRSRRSGERITSWSLASSWFLENVVELAVHQDR